MPSNVHLIKIRNSRHLVGTQPVKCQVFGSFEQKEGYGVQNYVTSEEVGPGSPVYHWPGQAKIYNNMVNKRYYGRKVPIYISRIHQTIFWSLSGIYKQR